MGNRIKKITYKISESAIATAVIGILICLIIPILIKIVILKPLFELIVISEIISKSIQGIISTVIILYTYSQYVKIFEKRKVTELSKNNLGLELFIGFSGGFIFISFIVFLFYWLGYYRVESINYSSVMIKPIIIFIVMGVWEEIIFRGIIFRIAENKFGTEWALLISSLIFGFVHATNDNFNFLSGLAIALELGLLTGIAFSITKRLWIPIALHIGWNASIVFYGLVVSGASEFDTFIISTTRGNDFITGGMFGIENSIITISLSLIVFTFLYRLKILLTNKE